MSSVKWKGALKITLSIGVITGFGYYLVSHWGQFRALTSVSTYHVVGILAGIVVTWILMSLQTLILLRSLGLKIGFFENLMLLLASVIGNYLPLRLGTILRVHYLKTHHGLSWGRFGSVLGLRLIIHVLSAGLLGLAGLWLLYQQNDVESPELVGCFSLMIVLALVAYFVPAPELSERSGIVFRIWREFSLGFAVLRKNPGLALKLAVLLLLQFLALTWRLVLAADAVQFHPPLAVFLLLTPITALMTVLTITPGSVGIREAVMGYITVATGFRFDQGLFAGTIDRGALLVLTFTLGLASFLVIWFRVNRHALPAETPQSVVNQ